MDAAADADSNFGIGKLPPEILIGIFEQLAARERKIVRLVCRQFYDACNVTAITDSEKLFFSSPCSTENMLTALMTYQQKFRNIEFVGKTFKTSSIPFWEKYGPNLCHLIFVSCEMDQEVFKEVIQRCSGLSYLCWEGSSLPFNNETLILLVKNNFASKSLRRLELYVLENWINIRVISYIFAIFPALKALTIKCRYEKPLALFSGLNEIQKRRFDIFQKLELKLIDDFGIELISLSPCDVMKQVLSSAKVKEFCGILDSIYMYLNVNEFIPNPPYLECGYFCSMDYDTKPFMKCISKILTACPNLICLELFGVGKGQINIEILKKLLTSSLESLVLRFRPPLIKPTYDCDHIRAALPFNDTIRALCIRKVSRKPHDLRLILEKFRNLKHLALHCVSDEIIQFLCRYQTNLKSLELHLGKFCTNEGFIPHSSNSCFYSMKRLTKLECLHITLEVKCWIAYDIFNTFRFPNLRYLELNFNGCDNNFVPILGFIKHLSVLETLSISNLNIPSRDLLSLCSDYLKRLRFLCIDSGKKCDIDDNYVRELFHRCRSVRVFKYSTSEISTICFFYNTLTGKIELSSIFDTLTPEMFSPFRGHWAGTRCPVMNFIADVSDSDTDSDAIESDSYDEDSDFTEYDFFDSD